MPAYVFQTVLEKGEAAGKLPSLEDASKKWFRKTAATTMASPNTILKSDRSRFRRRPMIGSMYLFSYDPKHKQTLPYYDRFPLVIPFDSIRTGGKAGTTDGFMGLNLHYLPPILRARLMDGLYSYVNNTKMDETTRLMISYRLMKRMSTLRFFKPCVKQYLFNHMRSPFFYIEPKEWDIALFLPLDRFVKADKNKIYKESRDAI